MATTLRKVLLCYCTFEDNIIGVRVDSQTDFNEFVDEVCGGLKVHANSVSLHYTTHFNKTCFLPLNGPRDLSNLLEFNNESAKLRDSPKYLPSDIINDFSRDHAISLTYKQAWRGKERLIDAAHLKGNYQGQLLAVNAYEANNQMFPVAFAVVSSESIPYWTWFLENLKFALNDDRKLVIVSDRNTSIQHIVETVFDSEYHNLDIYGWIIDSDPPHWANSLFKGRRYDKFTSNLVDSFNAWVLEAREQPIMSLVNIIRLKMTELTFRRQCEAKGYKQPVGPNIEDFLKFNISESINLGYTQCGDDEFEIRYKGKQEMMHLTSRSCSCKAWQMVGLPCVHACRAIGLLGLNIYDFVEECYLKKIQQAIYSKHIFAMPNSDMPDFSNESVSFMSNGVNHNVVNLLPPKQKRQPGRLRTKRIESQPIERREIHCSRCRESGHYRRTCRAAID
ncbi:PREDICTED: uncharacterized protein LOC104603111 [Nelumbo nucifera]|uniref:Uncharacterized protein LOC104603111 n=1 Tax=Nelumbo nucifera TaxID=4432 RepID=A0A1U8AQW5_NELNU|nr:PREDICTED: uncharacterized protein LOC104603111 [Nelumbo nucifera]